MSASDETLALCNLPFATLQHLVHQLTAADAVVRDPGSGEIDWEEIGWVTTHDARRRTEPI